MSAVWTDRIPMRRDRLEARAARDESIADLATAQAKAYYLGDLRAVLVELRRKNHLVAGLMDMLGVRQED